MAENKSSWLEKLTNWTLLLVVLVTVSSTLIAVDFLSNLVIHPNCCAEHLPSRAQSKEWEQLTSPADAGAKDAVHVKFPSQDGQTLEGWLTPGKKSSKGGEGKEDTGATMVVMVHDSGSDMRQVYELAREVQKRLGWGAMVFNTRETEISAFGRGATSDVLAAITFVRSGSHEITKGVKKVVVMGISAGAGAGMLASIKDTSVDAFVAISMPASAHQYWQSQLQTAVEELKHSVATRQAANIDVGWQAQFTRYIVEIVYSPVEQRLEESDEQSNFMAKVAELSKGWFIDFAAHLTVIRGAGYRAWLQGVADPHKSIHRIQPRGFLLVHGQVDTVTPLWLAQNIYNRAGGCQPKLARIQQTGGHVLDLRQDDEFFKRLRVLLQ